MFVMHLCPRAAPVTSSYVSSIGGIAMQTRFNVQRMRTP
jgi:hypothetical protein